MLLIIKVIVFKFIWNKVQYRWFLSENLTAFFTFSLTLWVGVIIKLRSRNQILQKNEKIEKIKFSDLEVGQIQILRYALSLVKLTS
jgi:hypothetical protein